MSTASHVAGMQFYNHPLQWRLGNAVTGGQPCPLFKLVLGDSTMKREKQRTDQGATGRPSCSRMAALECRAIFVIFETYLKLYIYYTFPQACFLLYLLRSSIYYFLYLLYLLRSEIETIFSFISYLYFFFVHFSICLFLSFV